MGQYLGRNYLLGVVEGFAAAEKSVHAGALEWGYSINRDLTVTAQGAVGEQRTTSRIYLGQLGAQYQLHPEYTLGLFARLLGDNPGAEQGGVALELGRLLGDDLMFSVGYSTLSLDDPDLSTLVDWPSSLYLRLRMKF